MTEPRIIAGCCLASFALLLLAGCVARDIGYAEVQRSLKHRTGQQVRWNHLESERKGDPITQNLLQRPLSADRAAQVALLNNPEVQAAFEELGLSRAELVDAVRLPNPTAEAGIRFGEETPEIDVALTIDLTELAMLPYRKNAANSSQEAATMRVTGQMMDLVLATKRAFFEYQAAEQRVRMQQSAVKAAAARLMLAEELRASGNVPELSWLLEQASYDETRLELAGVQTTRTNLRERLNELMGLWGHRVHWQAEAVAEPSDPALNLASVEQRALQSSLDLRRIEHEFAAAARRANLATLRGVLPELKAGVGAERQEDKWSVGPLVELELPIFYQRQAEVAAARADMRRQRSQHESIAVRVRAAVRAAASKLMIAHDSARHYRERLLPQRDRIVEQTQLMVNAMASSPFELLQAKREQLRTASLYIDALRDYWIARAELDLLLAGRLVNVAPLAGATAARAGRASH